MLKRLGLTFALITVLTAIVACNKDEQTEEGIPISYSSTEVKSFNLVKDDSVLYHLDSVFFSIDQVNARIFNADSLPKGTKVSRLVLNISYGTASAVEISWKRPGQTDSIYDYLKSTQDSVDFSNGPVNLKIVSLDGKAERNYTISVNVHNLEPDSLCWNQMAVRPLPSSFEAPQQQRTVSTMTTTYTLTGCNGSYCMASSEDVPADKWEMNPVSFGFEPDVESFAATYTALYILDKDGNLYCSEDGGKSWSATGEALSTIYGDYGMDIIGLSKDLSTIVIYPSDTRMERPEDFPVSGINSSVTLFVSWMVQPEFFIAGGQKADGTLSSTTWGFDGDQWAMVSTQRLPKPLKDVTIFPYYSFVTNKASWRVVKHANIMLIGGEDQDGNLNTTTYLSYDYGLHWAYAGDLLQLPDYVGPLTKAQAHVFSSELTDPSRAGSVWNFMPSPELPWWLVVENPALSRVSKPITEWECPYIYLFGGQDQQGNLSNTIWRGVINRLEFKPLQ